VTKQMERIVLAFSGGLETAVAIPWLAERYGAEVIAVTIDLGQGASSRKCATRAGDRRRARPRARCPRRIRAQLHRAGLKADATGPDGAPIGARSAGPLIAQQLVEIASIEQATAIAHAGTGRCDRRGRRYVEPALRVLTPARDLTMTRLQQLEYARARLLPNLRPSRHLRPSREGRR